MIDPQAEPVDEHEPAPPPVEPAESGSQVDVDRHREHDADLDLDALGRELDDVQTALGRLDDGTYWSDEVTGDPISDEVLATDPTARRAG